jgi:hypothetical protein
VRRLTETGNPSDEETKTGTGKGGDEGAEGHESDEEKAAAVDITALDTYTTLRLFMGVLAGAAWRSLGLVVNPKTNKIEKDLGQARTAIDVFEFIFKQIEGKLSEDEKRQLSGLLNDLKINFVTHQ